MLAPQGAAAHDGDEGHLQGQDRGVGIRAVLWRWASCCNTADCRQACLRQNSMPQPRAKARQQCHTQPTCQSKATMPHAAQSRRPTCPLPPGPAVSGTAAPTHQRQDPGHNENPLPGAPRPHIVLRRCGEAHRRTSEGFNCYRLWGRWRRAALHCRPTIPPPTQRRHPSSWLTRSGCTNMKVAATPTVTHSWRNTMIMTCRVQGGCRGCVQTGSGGVFSGSVFSGRVC